MSVSSRSPSSSGDDHATPTRATPDRGTGTTAQASPPVDAADGDEPGPGFAELGLPTPLLDALAAVGYETPTPIQRLTIPPLLEGHDLLGRAPTGTGKTAAFALPLLARLADAGADRDSRSGRQGGAKGGVRALVLTPTRELAIQVAEAFSRYARNIGGFRVLPVYGGQEYGAQIRALAKGVQIVVGTPGRVMDHMRRGTLNLDSLQALVLDEGDEMLRMGFIDDVEWVLERTPKARQVALFSATMPPQVRRIAERHLRDPVQISIEGKTTTATTIRQRVWMVNMSQKLDALTRILEVEPYDAILIFVRTKSATVELAEKLSARGLAASAMNGDMPQKQREQMVERLKAGRLDILVATDVVARGLDVDRISMVVNYDIPYDTESYVHRIGRTGRAGRTGEAILFVTPRERGLLGAIERATRQKIEPLALPTVEMVNDRRIADFRARIDESIATRDLGMLERLVERHASERDLPPLKVAAALARMALGGEPLLLAEPRETSKKKQREDKAARAAKRAPVAAEGERAPRPASQPARERAPVDGGVREARHDDRHDDGRAERTGAAPESGRETPATPAVPEIEMERFRIEVGQQHGVKTANIVGAIANEAKIESDWIGKVDIRDDHSIVELPSGMPKFLLKELKRVWVCGRQLGIVRLGTPRDPASNGTLGTTEKAASSAPDGTRPGRPKTRTSGPAGSRTKTGRGSADKPAGRSKHATKPKSKPASDTSKA